MKFLVLATMTLQLIAKSFAQPNLPTFNAFGDALRYADDSTYPNNFTASCLSASCPGLSNSNLCPYNNDGSFNCEAISRTMSILNECVATKSPLCNNAMDPIPIPPFYFSLSQFASKILGVQCLLAPNTGSITNFSHSVFSVSKDQCVSNGCLQIKTTNPNLYYYGSGNCGFRSVSVLRLATAYTMILPFTVTSQLYCNDTKSTAQSPKIVSKPKMKLNNFPSIVQNIITIALQNFIENSDLTKSLASFVTHLAANAIEATKQSCSTST